MQYFWGQIEQSLRDTMLHMAERYALTKLGTIYGFTFPEEKEITEFAYGAALHQAGYAKRGTRDSMVTIIEACLCDYNADIGTSTSNRLVSVSTHPDELIEYDLTPTYITSEDDWAGRYVRTVHGRHLVIGVELNVARAGFTGNVQVLKLAPIATDYTVPLPKPPVDNVIYSTPAIKLPFALRETTPGPLDMNNDNYPEVWSYGRPCVLEILLFDDVVERTPPTFLLDDGNDVTPAGPPAMPFGGHLMATTNELGNQNVGPFPVYLIDGLAFSSVEEQLNRLMAAGTRCSIQLEPAR